MKLNEDGKALIKDFESCRLEAYPDPMSDLAIACRKAKIPTAKYRQLPNWKEIDGEPWTIGWGHTGKDVTPGLVWTQEQADKAFEIDIQDRVLITKRLAKAHNIQHLTSNEFSALVSFVYNCRFNTAKNLFRNCTRVDDDGDAYLDPEAVTQYLETHASANGISVPGLAFRRKQEKELFLKPDEGMA